MIQVLNSEDEFDKSSSVYALEFIVTCVASSSKEEKEEEEMPLERKRGLCELLMGRAKGLAPKDASGSQLPPPLPSLSINPFAPANLKKRKKDKKVVEEGELVLYYEGVSPKMPKTTKGKERASLVESKEDRHMA